MRDLAPSPDRPGTMTLPPDFDRRQPGRLAALALAGGAVAAGAARPGTQRRSQFAGTGRRLRRCGCSNPAVCRWRASVPHAQPLDGGEALLSRQAARPFVLASTSKLLTSMAALDLLGPAYCWRTCAYLSGPLTQGRLLGDLVIRGGGDATLTSADLLQWFREIRAQGLREVWGDIVINREAFRLRPEDLATTPEPTPERPHHVRPDALALDAGWCGWRCAATRAGAPTSRSPCRCTMCGWSTAWGGRWLRGQPRCCATMARSLQPQSRSAVSGRHAARAADPLRRWACAIWVPVPSRAWLQAGGVLRGRVVEHDGGTPTPGVSPRPVAVQRRLPSICRRRYPVAAARDEQAQRQPDRTSSDASPAPDFPDRSATAEAAGCVCGLACAGGWRAA